MVLIAIVLLPNCISAKEVSNLNLKILKMLQKHCNGPNPYMCSKCEFASKIEMFEKTTCAQSEQLPQTLKCSKKRHAPKVCNCLRTVKCSKMK